MSSDGSLVIDGKDSYVSAGKPNLTYLITGLQFGGANVGMVRLLSELSPEEFNVTVVSVATTDEDVVPLLPGHVDVVQCRLDTKLALHRLRPLVQILRDTDVLVCSLFHATIVGTIFGSLLRVPTILVWHHNTEHPNRTRPLLYRYANSVADRVLADSNAVEQLLVDEYGQNPSDISVLPIAGVDTDVYAPDGAGEREPGDPLQVATVGRLTEQKGYRFLLDCARRLGDEYEFSVAGTGALEDSLRDDAPENVTFHGKVPDDEMPGFYATADVYFQPSRWEGLCMTVIEAMACGLPVVASAVGGITESVVADETGYLCEPGDVDCYCERLCALADDESRRRSMGSAGRERVRDRYSARVLGETFREAVARAQDSTERQSTKRPTE